LYDLQEFLREKRGTTISKTVIEFDKNTHLASSKIMSGSRPNWGSDYYFSTSASSNLNFVSNKVQLIFGMNVIQLFYAHLDGIG